MLERHFQNKQGCLMSLKMSVFFVDTIFCHLYGILKCRTLIFAKFKKLNV